MLIKKATEHHGHEAHPCSNRVWRSRFHGSIYCEGNPGARPPHLFHRGDGFRNDKRPQGKRFTMPKQSVEPRIRALSRVILPWNRKNVNMWMPTTWRRLNLMTGRRRNGWWTRRRKKAGYTYKGFHGRNQSIDIFDQTKNRHQFRRDSGHADGRGLR